MPGFAVSSSTLFMTSAKTPPAIVQKLNEIFRESILAPETKAKLNGMAQIVAGDTPAQALGELRPEHAQFGKVIKERNIKFAQ